EAEIGPAVRGNIKGKPHRDGVPLLDLDGRVVPVQPVSAGVQIQTVIAIVCGPGSLVRIHIAQAARIPVAGDGFKIFDCRAAIGDMKACRGTPCKQAGRSLKGVSSPYLADGQVAEGGTPAADGHGGSAAEEAAARIGADG